MKFENEFKMKIHRWAESGLRLRGSWASGPLHLQGQNGWGGRQWWPNPQPKCSNTGHRVAGAVNGTTVGAGAVAQLR
jgi:hypothetical protein